MEPTLREGEQVRVRAVRAAALRAGEVILFEIPGGAVELHRLIVRLPRGVLVHRGDNPSARPGLVRVDRVIGRAELAARPPGRRAVLGALAAIVAARCATKRRVHDAT
jgi:hypothetical protein